MTAHTIIPRCPVCGAVNQAWRREWDYFATDEFCCKICKTVWYQDPVRPLERMVLVRGKPPAPLVDAAEKVVVWLGCSG